MVLITGLALTAGGPATAAPPTSPVPSPLEQCVAAAEEARHALWSCVGGTLAYVPASPESELLAQGGSATTTSASAYDSEWIAAPDESEWITEVIARVDPRPNRSEPAGDVTILGNGDTWDVWCEAGSHTCTREITRYYTWETKQNVVWGNQNGAHGDFDMILRTNLNGRQPRYTVGLNVDTGVNTTINAKVNCVHDKVFDGNCGKLTVPQVHAGNYRSSLMYGTKITASGTFFSTMTGTHDPDGAAPTMALPTLKSKSFTCPKTGNCKFP